MTLSPSHRTISTKNFELSPTSNQPSQKQKPDACYSSFLKKEEGKNEGNKKIEERKVTVHFAEKNTLEATPQESRSSEPIDGVNKKKKKKPAHAKEVSKNETLLTNLGNSFVLPALNPLPNLKTTSIFEAAYCPKFNSEQQQKFLSLIDKSAFCKNINLFEVFLMDLSALQNQIIEEMQKSYYQEEPFKTALRKFTKHNLTFILFKTYLLIHARLEEKEFGIDLKKDYDEKLYCTLQEAIQFIGSYHIDVLSNLGDINNLYNKKTADKSVSIQNLYKKQLKSLKDLFNELDSKVDLLLKCLSSEQAEKLLLTRTAEWRESYPQNGIIENNSREIKLKKFQEFLNTFLIKGKETGILGYVEEIYFTYINFLGEMITQHFSDKAIAKFISKYKLYSTHNYVAHFRLNQAITRARQDSSYTYAIFCQEQGCKSLRPDIKTQNQFIAILTELIATFDLKDKWISEINQAMTHYFLSDNEKFHVSPTQSFVQRLLMLTDLAAKYQEFPNISMQQQEPLLNPLVKTLHDKIDQSISKIESQFHDRFRTIVFAKVNKGLQYRFSAPTFRLSRCLIHVSQIAEKTQDLSFLKLQEFLNDLLETIREEIKQNHLVDIDHLELKKTIQSLLLKRSLKICTYIMMAADIRALVSVSRANDYSHLLPDDLVKLLTLDGFDEIFLPPQSLKEPVKALVNLPEEKEPPVAQTPSVTVTVISKVNTLTTSVLTPKKNEKQKAIKQAPLPKKVEVLPDALDLPTKRDFIEAERFSLVDELLKNLEFELLRIKGSHHIYGHKETHGIVVVPKHDGQNGILKVGTLNSIGKQAIKALPPREFKDS